MATRRLLVLSALVGTCLISGCTSSPTAAPATVTDAGASSASASTTTLPAPPTFTNDLAQGSAHHEVLIPGETFSLTVDYWLTSDPAAWTTLGMKTMHFAAHTVPVAGAAVADQPTVLVEFSEASAVVRSTDVALDGQLIQDHRDAPATGAVPGYIVSGDLPYEGVFAIDASSSPLLGRWAELGRPGPVDSAALVAAGVYANEITYTYSLLIRGATATDGYYHRRLVQDVITVGTPQG